MPKADITVSHAKFTKHGPDNHQLIAEISELGWSGFPQYVGVHGHSSVRLFGPRIAVMNGEEVGGYLYPQTDRSLSAPVCEVHVLND
jgi:hypothetical protein